MEQALSGDPGWHMAMLLDEVRVGWFARAIAATVRPGDVALDLGTGTGLLAMLAARAGARRVYAMEQSPILEVARELVVANGLSEVVTLVPGSSFDLEPPERADVVISETLGAWGADEGIVAIMADALHRLAKPDARLIPDGVTMWLAPLAETAARIPHLEALGLDLQPLLDRLAPSTSGRQAEVMPSRLLAPAQRVLSVTLGRQDLALHEATLDFDLQADATADALCGWFTATAAGVEALSTGPDDPGTMWGQVVVPLATPISGSLRVDLRLGFEQDSMDIELRATRAPTL